MAIKWILAEAGHEEARALLDSYANGKTLLLAPDLIRFEISNVLTRHVRRKQLTAQQAREAFAVFESTSPEIVSSHSLVSSALEIAFSNALSFWDSVYIALAREYECQVLTADGRLHRAGSPRHGLLQFMGG